jgi:tRNA-Thr(GGU) m(6)t(6)A37 methyltransferase TsaA
MPPDAIEYRPIGVIHSPFKEAAGSPIQGVFAEDAEGVVEVFEEYAEGLRELELFSHVYLLYHFHRAGPVSLAVVPFLDDREHGVFATRAPSRPNGIGLSIVRLLARDGRRIHVAQLDVLDGTPLLDLKPYVPQFDHRPTANSGWIKGTDGGRIARRADNRFGA